jgi:acyl carrier protein
MMKQTLVTEQKVLETVQNNIAEALRIPVAKITPERSLIKDLGAESLDFLDMNYRMEQSFGIRTARHFVVEHVEELFGEGAAVDENGRLTEKGVAVLRLRLGDHQDLQAGMTLEDVPSFVTVRAVASGVFDILGTLPEQCTYCGQSQWKSDDGSHIHCGACGKAAVYASGDDLVKDWLRRIQQEKSIF